MSPLELSLWVAQTWPCFDKLRIVSVNNQDRVFRPYLKTFTARLNRTKCEDVGFNFCSWKAWLVKSLITPLSILRGVHQTYPFWHFCKGFLSRRLLMTWIKSHDRRDRRDTPQRQCSTLRNLIRKIFENFKLFEHFCTAAKILYRVDYLLMTWIRSHLLNCAVKKIQMLIFW